MALQTLGIDLGTNSIGWAITSRKDIAEENVTLQDYGVYIFPQGVLETKSGEEPAVKQRTEARASRRRYARRRLHKIQLLKVLISNGLAPYLSEDDLDNWQKKKVYPMNPDYLKWQRTDDNFEKNPYRDRHESLTRVLDLTLESDRFTLGRALYHLAQRRGFLSNRKDLAKESDGVVKTGIDNLSEKINEMGMSFPGEYFYYLYRTGEKIRNNYQHRIQHVEREFYAICEMQGLKEDLIARLHKAIFFQRPLKSQKGLIGKCKFERNKQRCAVSHPEFEEFRMLCFLNNIKIKHPSDGDFRPLSPQEKQQIMPLFMRKSKGASFNFEDIAKKIAGKNNYTFRDLDSQLVQFNYAMDQQVPASPVTGALKSLFGDDYIHRIKETYVLGKSKSAEEAVNDVWHVLASFDSDEHLIKWAEKNLSLSHEDAIKFSEIHLPQGYASLSLKAIRKITPLLRRGFRYDQAVFSANIPSVLDRWFERTEEEQTEIINDICCEVVNFTPSGIAPNIQSAVKHYLEDKEDINLGHLGKLYHPSKIEKYPDAEVNKNGQLLLGSPRTEAIRNPMAMRALFSLRHLINTLLREGKINRTTRINIEFSRMLNNANLRHAIQRYQRELNKEKDANRKELIDLYKAEAGVEIEPTDTDLLKFKLWKEQGRCCLYTGKQIGVAEFIGPMPKYDIEHTVPRSLGGDNSQENKTLCDVRFNREVKRNILPALLPEAEVIRERIKKAGWEKGIHDLRAQISRKITSGFMTKEEKDKIIAERHYLKLKLNYLLNKYRRFEMTEVPEGFTNRQGVDIGIIGKYAYHYLATLFKSENRQIFTVKGATTAEFRLMWGLQEKDTTKGRDNHCHHAIDAIVIACIGRNQYHRWAQYNRDMEAHELDSMPKPVFPKPWSTFTQDVKGIVDSLVVVHHTEDRRLRDSRKLLRKRGRIEKNSDGQPVYLQGDTARMRLHQDTFYGAISNEGTIKYVIRKPLSNLEVKDIANIVDPVVRKVVQELVDKEGINALSSPVYLNREKGVVIKKVRIFANLKNPLLLKSHTHQSKKEHKKFYHVANDSNYCMGIYEGTSDKGKPERSFKLVNALEAVKRRKAGEPILPLSDDKGHPLKHTLTPGLMVIFYDKSPKEIYEASAEELVKRVYKISGLSILRVDKYQYGLISFRHHQNAQPTSDLNFKKGRWAQDESLRQAMAMNHSQFNALVEGEDFIISESGKITFFHPNI
ncbi:MAG: CRISPR-associated protein Csn1 [Muribaculaceae bacterium]|nr:CRISPR-associated protein Csn1 [Muribaculaceae bacterium]